MKNRIVILITLILFAGSANANGRTFVAVPSPGQEVNIDQGVTFVSQSGINVDVSVGFISESDTTGWIYLYVRNRSNDAEYISEHSLSLVSNQSNQLQIFSTEELTASQNQQIKKAETKKLWGRIALATLAALGSQNAGAAGYSTVTGTYDGTASNQYGRTNYNGNYTAQVYDQQKAQQAIAEANQKNYNLVQGKKVRDDAEIELLKQQMSDDSSDLFPFGIIVDGQVRNGKIRIALPNLQDSANAMTLVIHFPNETFQIQFIE